MGFFDPVVSVHRLTYRKLEQLVSDLYYFENDEEITGSELRQETEHLVNRVLTEFARQHYDESNRNIAKMLSRKKATQQLYLP